ncbi:hypothetical protein GGF44_002935, partial [Coemansia sp. RSA 1694]
MYDYVRRQQETQPNMFSSKTFQWMDHSSATPPRSVREPGWVKVYAKNLPRDPLAYSSSSLFTAPRVAAAAAGNGFQRRTAGNHSPHRPLFAFRRQRQTSDADMRPPSGISSVFEQPRRRGFTAPPGSHPSFDGSIRLLGGARDAAASHKDAADPPHCQPNGPSPLPPIGEPQIAPAEEDANSSAAAEPAYMRFAGGNSKRGGGAGGEARGREPSFSSCLFPALGHLSHHHPRPSPQLFSSFSPPLSPHPRTLCAKARSLMHRVRRLKPPSAPAQQPPSDHRVPQSQRAGPSYGRAQPPRGSGASATAARPHGSARRAQPRRPPPPPEVPGAAPRTRALPRSPLANPMVIAQAEPCGGRASDCVSSDEEMLRCEVCHHDKGADWTVRCNDGHLLCFACIQAHVRTLLADKPLADVVFCMCAGCQSYVPSRFLRQCLSPQRFKQIVDNCVQGFQTRQLAKRSGSSLCADQAEDAGIRPLAGQSEEGFDEPLVVAETTSVFRPESPPGSAVAAGCVPSRSVVADMRGLAQAVGGLAVSEQPYSASMPVLPRRSHHQAAEPPPQQPGVPAAFVSELTTVERASMDSLVFAASVAADSSLTLSPESVGSRLRRVAKAQENVRASPESHSTGALEASPASLLGQTPVFPHNDSQPGGAPQQQQQAVLYDYADMDLLDAYMRTPRPPPPQIPLFACAASPISWSPAQPQQPVFPAATAQQQPQPQPARTPPPLPPSLPAHFRASATWITPEQRYSGYTENILLNATLFETIRRQPSPVGGYGYESDGHSSLGDSPRAPAAPQLMLPALSPSTAAEKTRAPPPPSDDDTGVYIPTWRRADDARVQYPMPLWAASEFGSQSG